MIPRPDMLDDWSPEGVEVFQLTTEKDTTGSHLYMEAQIFTPDSRRLIVHRSTTAHGADIKDPEHCYMVCDLDNNGELTPITHETGARAASLSPDGRVLYYFVDETFPGGGRFRLKRVRMDGAERETLAVIDTPIRGALAHLFRLYPLSTISSDGRRLAISGLISVAPEDNPPGALLVFDLETGEHELALIGAAWINIHPQYSRSLEHEASQDILVQHNHGGVISAEGKTLHLISGAGADIHVIRDDGTNLRDMPWGRDGNEFCQGHQCWRGRSERGITSTGNRGLGQAQLIEGVAAPHAGHVGLATPGGRRNDLSASVEDPQFSHFATDIQGRRLISDSRPKEDDGGRLFLADLPEAEDQPLSGGVMLFSVGSSWKKEAHIHPFLSPDGSAGFFNSDESGILQAYMVRGLDAVAGDGNLT